MLRYTSRMQLRINTYIDGESFVHTCDARVKVLLLCAYTATVFWVETWAGQWLLGFLCLVLALSAHVPLGRMLAMGIPVYMMAALTVLFASINNQVGFALGCFYGVRMILLVLGSFIVVLTTTSTALTDALRSFVSPLRVLHVPADDIAMVFSMAISSAGTCRTRNGDTNDRNASVSAVAVVVSTTMKLPRTSKTIRTP